MAQSTCSIDGCTNVAGYRGRALRGWCVAHYTVWRNHGDPTARAIRPPNTGRCQVCGEPSASARLNWCEACYCRTWRNGHSDYLDPHVKEPSYRAAHSRIERARGKAADHDCVDCDGAAAHWSFAWRMVPSIDWQWEVVNGTNLAFTGKPLDYEPRCRKCARWYDSDFAKQGWRSHRHHSQTTAKESPAGWNG